MTREGPVKMKNQGNFIHLIEQCRKKEKYRFNPYSCSIDVIIVEGETQFSMTIWEEKSRRLINLNKKDLQHPFVDSFEEARIIGLKYLEKKIKTMEFKTHNEKTKLKSLRRLKKP